MWAQTTTDIESLRDGTGWYNSDQVCSGGGGTGGDVDKFIKALVYQESGGDPTQPGSAGSARGKYQYIDSTWESSARTYYGPALAYTQAHLAPEEMQDAVAYLEYTKKFKDLGNDLFRLAVSHFYPIANSDPSKLDIVPPSNVITPRQYAEKLIKSIKDGGEWEKIPLKYDQAPEFAKWADKIGGVDASGSTSAGGCVDSDAGGDAVSVEGSREELAQRIEDSTNTVFGNYGNASSQRSDIRSEDKTSIDLLKLMVAATEQSGARLLINAINSDHASGTAHGAGRAIDIGYYGNGQPNHTDEGDKLYKFLYKNREKFKIKQLIWQYPPSGYKCINNAKPVECSTYGSILNDHYHHIHAGL